MRIDTGAPQPLGVTLAPGQDNGLYTSDAIVSSARPTFRVSLPPEVVEGDLVQLYRHSYGTLSYQIGLKRLDALDLSRGWVDLTSTTALSGDYNGTVGGWGIFARITDAAGNVIGRAYPHAFVAMVTRNGGISIGGDVVKPGAITIAGPTSEPDHQHPQAEAGFVRNAEPAR